MDESLLKINSILNSFNQTFKLKIEETEGNEVNSLSIEETIGDGKDFINEIVDLFEKVISNITDDYSLVFTEDKGLIIAQKINTIDYKV